MLPVRSPEGNPGWYTPRPAELDRIFRLENERTISEDWVVRYDNRFFQL
jgi:hypothetical protein